MKNKDFPFVSIVILNFNGGSILRACLNSVLKTKYPNFEIVLWDNGSSQKEQEQLKRLFSRRVKLILKKKNYGFAEANNLALKEARGKYVVFLNNDTEVDSDWLKSLVKKMNGNKKVAFLQPKIIAIDNRRFFNYAGAVGGMIDSLGYTFARGRVFDYVEMDKGQYDNGQEIFWASGVAIMVQRDVFEKLGGFDKRFFACQEEVDLCFRALRAGYKILVVPQSVVYHLGSVTLNRNLANRVFLNHRNQLFLLFKNLKIAELFWVLSLRAFLDLGAALYYLYHRNLSLFLSVFRAYYSFILNLPGVIKIRVSDKIGNFGFPKDDTVYRGSLIFDYFVLKKRSYTEIFNKRGRDKIPVCRSDRIKDFDFSVKDKQKIVFLIWNTKKCGGHKLIFEYINRLLKRGYCIKILSVLGGSVDWFNLKVPIEPLLNFVYLKKRTDILIATFWPTAYLALLLPAKKKFYFILGWEPDYYSNFFLSFLARFTYKFPFHLVAISKFLKEKTEALFNQGTNIFIAPVAIDTVIFKPGKLPSRHSSPKRILSVVSSYQLYKGLDNLVKVIKKLKKRYPEKLHFVLVSFEKKTYSSVFDEFLSNISVSKLVDQYHRADLLLATPRIEGFFLPGIEAMACGCPVVMTDSGGVQEYAKNSYNCLLAKNIEEIVKKRMIKRVLNNSSLRDKLIKNGLKTAERFSWVDSIGLLEKYLIDNEE